MANLSTIITGQTPLGGATEKNYVQASDAPGNLWVASGAGVAVSLETSVANLPESTTKKSAIKILRASGSDYVRYRFVIDKVDGAKTFKIQWGQLYSGAAGDYTISVTSFTDSGYSIGPTTLPVTTSSIPAVNGVWTVTFNTSAFTVAPYIELRINAIAGTTPLYISGVIVGPGITAQGAVISEWQTFTPTWGNVTLGNGTSSGAYRRVGSQMDVRIKLLFGSTTSITAPGLTATIPTGFTLDTLSSPTAVSAATPYGYATLNDAGVQTYSAYIAQNGANTDRISVIAWDDVTGGVGAANVSATVPFTWGTSDFVSGQYTIPVSEWAGSGTVTLSGGAILEYASNSSTSNANDTTSFVAGSAGSLIPTITASAGTVRADKTVQFQYPIQADDILVVEVQNSGTGAWIPTGDNQAYDKFHAENTNRIGVGIITSTLGGLTAVVTFAHGGANGQGAYGAVGSSYPVGVGDRWRVRKAKASAPVGIDTSALSGSGGSGFLLSLKTSNFTAATLNHYLVDTSAIAITATLPSGATSAAIKFSDDQRTWSVRPLTITPAISEKIDGQAINETFICDVSGATIQVSWDGTKWVLDSNTIQSTVSITTGNSLTEKNYITRPDSAATDWVTSNGAQVTVDTESSAGNLPENATKQTAIKILRSAGTTSYIYTRMVLDSADAGKKLKLQWNQKYAGTAGDYTIQVFSFTASDYSTGSSQLTSVQTSSIPALASGTFLTSFDAPASTAPYLELRIIAAAGTTPLYLSGVLVGPGVITQGATISEWQSQVFAVPLNLGAGSGTVSAFSRRVGSDLEVKLFFGKDATPGSGAAAVTFTMPTGYTINTAVLVSRNYLGYGSTVTTIFSADADVTALTSTTFALRKIGSATNLTGADVVAGSEVVLTLKIPIAEWAGSGTVNLGPGAQEYYVANSGTTLTAGGNNAVGSTVYGSGGVPILAVNSVTAGNTTVFSCTPLYPLSSGDTTTLEVSNDGLAWYPVATSQYAFANQGTSFYGFGISFTSPTVIILEFGNSGFRGNNGTYGGNGQAWSALSSTRWRVRVCKASSPVGFGIAGTDGSAGLVAPYSAAGVVASGRYTPTLVAGTNVAAVGPFSALYSRVGKTVTVSGFCTINTTAGANAASAFTISLPIASTLTSFDDIAGTFTKSAAAASGFSSGYIAWSSGTVATVNFNSVTSGNNNCTFQFQYEIK